MNTEIMKHATKEELIDIKAGAEEIARGLYLDIDGLNTEIDKLQADYAVRLSNMTIRAEQAERERDMAIAILAREVDPEEEVENSTPARRKEWLRVVRRRVCEMEALLAQAESEGEE